MATHRVHHQFSDKQGDPHTPRDGKWWSHILWMMVGDVTHCDAVACAKYAPDLAADPFYVWLSKWHWVPLTVVGIALLAIGGLPWLLWGVFFRVTLGLHATWMVNSLTHIWGARRFDTRDDSRNNWFVAALSFGEGWHNNHHAHPTSARHGLAWYESRYFLDDHPSAAGAGLRQSGEGGQARAGRAAQSRIEWDRPSLFVAC